MKAKYLRIISMLLVLVMLFSLGLTSCKKDDKDNNDGENSGVTPETPETPENPETPEAPEEPDDEYTLPKEEGHNQLTIYWDYATDYQKSSFWIWPEGGNGTSYAVYPCSYGVKCVVNIPDTVTTVGFIACYSCTTVGGNTWPGGTKDIEVDRFVQMNGDTTIYLKFGDEAYYSSQEEAENVLPSIKSVTIDSFNTMKYTLGKAVKITDLSQIKVSDGERDIPVTALTSISLKASTGIITLGESVDLTKTYTVSVEGHTPKTAMPYKIFDSDEFINNYTYDGDDLGAVINGSTTTFKVWAPTASEVLLNLFSSGHEGEAYETVAMTKGDKGVWSHTASCGHGTYYTYTVTTSIGTNTAVDPYARAVGLNGNRGMVVDLSTTDPEGWGAEFTTGIKSYTDAIIWEVHVRDFSNKIEQSNYKGKYLAFTERGLVNEYGKPVGVDYLIELGITHVHLLPVYDFATIDEASPEDEFNWGYDPKNYNAPEGSYSTNPYDGAVRINEYKQMVKALHEAGIGVVMDMVYNHTYDANSSFHKLVPYYYYRHNANGSNTSASGCGNDTASERYMFGKFMVDSVKYWAEEYDLDGFRFDLMGLHDLATMQKIENAVHTINPEAIIYGEGWTMGATIDGSDMANQSNIGKITVTEGAIGGIAVFNDAIRDGLKGSVFDKESQGYISGTETADMNKVLFGIKGGNSTGTTWRVPGSMVINYMSAHDNNTLWDKLLLSNGDDTVQTRLAMNRLGATIIFASKGTPFFQAGEEMLRTKDGDENSYKSSDEINNIDWSVLNDGTDEMEMMLYYKHLIEVRKTFMIFTDVNSTVTETKIINGRMTVKFTSENGEEALLICNPTVSNMTYQLSGSWNLVVNGVDAGDGTIERYEDGTITIPAFSAIILVNDECFVG